MAGTQETRPRKSIEEFMLRFDRLDHQTHGMITAQLSSLKNLLTDLTPALINVAEKQAIVETGQAYHKILAEARNPSSVEPNAADYGLTSGFTGKVEAVLEDRIQPTHFRVQDLDKETESQLEDLRDELTEKVLSTIEMMMTWMEAPTPSEDHHKKKQYRERVAGYLQILRNERDDLKEKLDESRENTRNEKNKVNILESKLSAAESGIVEMKKILENKYRELVKNYYNKVQNLVEGRVRDEKAKLADRLSTAEAKVLQYAKVLGEKEVLEAMISQERQEKALLKQAKLELEKRYKDRDDEAKALREGYNQLSNDIQILQTEKAVLQADYDGLKREQERLPEGNQSSSKPRHADQPAVSSPHFSATTAFDRQTAELQHLDGLVAIWQTTLDNATADRNESRNKKEALQTKIQEAKQQPEKLKPASPSKPHRRSDTKSTSKNIGTKEEVAVEVKSAGQVVPQSSSSTSGTLLNTRILAEPFPALSSPTVLQTTPSNTWRTLRLIDVPKQQKPDTKKNSG